MVYMKAQADTANDIADWNTKGEYVLRQLETVRFATQPALMRQIEAAEDPDHLISPEERLRIAMARQ